MDKYIFTYIDENRDGIFRDLTSEESRETIDFLLSHKRFNNSFLEKIKKICLSYQLNIRFHVPFQSVFYNLDAYNYETTNIYHIIMPTTSISKFTTKYLADFKKRHVNVRLYALVTDSMHASSPHMNLVREKLFSNVWEKVLTYDKYDAEEFGFTWFGYTYYSSYDFVRPDTRESDIYYVGYDKGGREQIVLDIYQAIVSKGRVARFDVLSNKQNDADSGLVYLKNKISYPQVVSRVKSSNCILEVLQNNQQAQSLRYFEAIVYNKKLLTNNPRISELPYYDKRYMKVFDTAQDIDIEWLGKKETIEYGYKGDFSPIKIIPFIEGLKNI